MKKIYLLVFSFLIFLLSFTPLSGAFAQDLTALSNSEKQTVKVEYELPYPGLLPDNPLYPLRIIRDKIVGFLISDSLKKTEFNLLQADKRLNAGIYLFNKGKISLSLSTISKAENYFSEALDKMQEARIQGESTGDIEGKLKTALKKHQQELEYFVEKTGNSKPGFEKELKRIMGFGERLNQ